MVLQNILIKKLDCYKLIWHVLNEVELTSWFKMSLNGKSCLNGDVFLTGFCRNQFLTLNYLIFLSVPWKNKNTY